MKYILVSKNTEIDAAKFVLPTLMFHGTSYSRVREILKKGLGITKNINRITKMFEPLGNAYLAPTITEALKYVRKAIEKQENNDFNKGLLVVCKTILQDHSLSLSDDELLGILFYSSQTNIIEFLKSYFHKYLPKPIHKTFNSFLVKEKENIINLANKYKTEFIQSPKIFVQKYRKELKHLGSGLGQFLKYFDPFQKTNLSILTLHDPKNISTKKQISYKGNPKIVCVIQVKFNPDIVNNISLKILWKGNFDITILESYFHAEHIKYNWIR